MITSLVPRTPPDGILSDLLMDAEHSVGRQASTISYPNLVRREDGRPSHNAGAVAYRSLYGWISQHLLLLNGYWVSLTAMSYHSALLTVYISVTACV